MQPETSAREQPFWADDPDSSNVSNRWTTRIISVYSIVLQVLIGLMTIALVGTVLAMLSPQLACLWLVLCGLMLAASFFAFRRGRAAISRVRSIQAHAREQTGASVIGSAMHVAGHPRLARNQPVVLVLQQDRLCIHVYENPKPIDSISLDHLQSIHTVVYDDERVPHLEAIDSAAQALQLTFVLSGESWTCLFQRMRKVRPVDWYHALQQARLAATQARTRAN